MAKKSTLNFDTPTTPDTTSPPKTPSKLLHSSLSASKGALHGDIVEFELHRKTKGVILKNQETLIKLPIQQLEPYLQKLRALQMLK